MTIQLLGKDDHITDEAISAEEKWSLYVDQFVQVSTTEHSILSGNHTPFLKRNLPDQVGEDPPQDVETKSGLELKICANSYKIHFVDNTEDYFCRKRAFSISNLGLQPHSFDSVKKSALFREWLNSEKGWKSGLSGDAVNDNAAAVEKLKTDY